MGVNYPLLSGPSSQTYEISRNSDGDITEDTMVRCGWKINYADIGIFNDPAGHIQVLYIFYEPLAEGGKGAWVWTYSRVAAVGDPECSYSLANICYPEYGSWFNNHSAFNDPDPADDPFIIDFGENIKVTPTGRLVDGVPTCDPVYCDDGPWYCISLTGFDHQTGPDAHDCTTGFSFPTGATAFPFPGGLGAHPFVTIGRTEIGDTWTCYYTYSVLSGPYVTQAEAEAVCPTA